MSPIRRPAAARHENRKLAPLAERLAKLGLVSEWDFVLHLPIRYEDETRLTDIRLLRAGEYGQCQGRVVQSHFQRTARGQIFSATLTDGTGELTLTFFNYYQDLAQRLKTGAHVRVYGQVGIGYGYRPEMVHPKIRVPLEDAGELPQTLTPIYALGENVQQAWLRRRIARAMLDVDLTDPVPEAFRSALQLPALRTALQTLHTPPADARLEDYEARSTPAWRRLKYDELLAQQITLRDTRRLRALVRAPQVVPREGARLCADFLGALPFSLTRAQVRVLGEIERDLARPTPMNRLVQGDVGSGKTAVAAAALLRAVESGAQCALMAPTEILCEQHYAKLADWFEPLGVTVVCLASAVKGAKRAEALAALAEGRAQVAVGTHALIQEHVKFRNLALAVIDEQHRFGVEQRLALRSAGPEGAAPHLLMLSATPIPRTLAMSYLADLDVSVIDELPPGRTPVDTRTISLARENEVVAGVRRAVEAGRQIYWVCPLIEESEALELTAATDRYERLRAALPGVSIGLLHGAMKRDEKAAVMRDFIERRISVLVATTVIEVGVDVPNASVMVIEHAERFGLAQLHQLRGRVGRGATRSACLLLHAERLSEDGRERLSTLRETNDGFEVARRDLKLRGPGEFLGERQSGLPMLRFADLESDEALLARAADDARRWLDEAPEAALQFASRWFKRDARFLNA